MAFRDALKRYREAQSSNATSSTVSTTPSETSKPSTTGLTGSGGSFRDALKKYREYQETSSLEGWAEASKNLITDTQSLAFRWSDGAEYEAQSRRYTSLLANADNWRKKYAGNKDAISYIDSVVAALEDAKRYSFSSRKYYSQWETEEDYNSYLTEQNEYEKKKNYNLDAGQKEIDALESVLEEYNTLTRKVQTLAPSSSEYIAATNRMAEISKQYGGAGKNGIEAAISEKKSYMNQAKHIQEGITLSGAIDNDDFDQYSGYISTRSDGLSKLWSQYGLGYEDLTYEYINGAKNGMRSEIINKSIAYNSDNSLHATDKFTIYDHMTDDEISIYNYYYAKDGKETAQKYLDSIQETLNHREATKMFSNMEDKTLLEMAFGVVAGLDQFESGSKNLFNTEDDYIPHSAVQIASSMVREDLADFGQTLPDWLGGASLGQVAYDTVTTSANMAPSILTSMAVGMINPLAGEIIGTSLMGASAAGNAYQEALNMGAEKGQARAYSVLTGASEAGLQYLLGGIGKLGGKLSGNAVTKMLNGVDKAFFRAAGKLAGNMASEGLEEGLQEILTPLFKSWTMHIDEDVNWEDVAYSSLLGALTAGFMEGGNTISGEVNTYRTGKKLQTAGISAQRLSEIGKTFSADTVAYQLAGRVNENTGAYTIGRLFNEIGATLSEQNVTEITNALVAKGMGEKTARKNAEALAYVVEGGQLSEKQIAVIEANDVLSEVARTTLIDANTTWNQRSKGYNEALKALAEEMTSPKASRIETAQQSEENTPTSDTVDTKKENGTEILSEADSVDTSPAKVQSISSVKNGQATIKLEDGSEVDVKKADLDPDDGVRIETIASIEGISATDANFILNTLRTSTNASAQMDSLGAKEAYKYGFFGFSQEHMTKHGVFANSLTETQRQAIYEIGKNARQKQIESATYKNGTGTGRQTEIYFDAGNGNVEKFTNSKKMSTMTDKQKSGVQAAMILRKLGIGGDIYFFESYRNSNGQLVYKDKHGNEVKAPNGWYEQDGSIHIDLNAGANGQGFILFTLAHELTHFIEQWSPKKYKILADFLVENYENGQSMDKLVRAKQEKLSALRGKKVSYSEAYSEVIADSMEAMLADGNVTEKLIDLKAKDNSLFMKLKQFFDNLLNKIRSIYKGQTPDSAEGRAVLEMTESIEKIQQLFADALVDASENFQNAEKNTTKDGGAKNQFRGYAEDGRGIYESNFPKGTPKKAKAARILSLIQDVWSKKPITLKIEDENGIRYITAEFDPTYDETGRNTDASKLMGGNRHGTRSEQRVTLDLADDYYQIAEESTYNYSKEETGKASDTHKDVRYWHYFINDIYFSEYGSEELAPYRVSINVKEKTDGNFFYSFSAEKMEETSTQRTLHAAVSSSNETATNGDLFNATLTPEDQIVKPETVETLVDSGIAVDSDTDSGSIFSVRDVLDDSGREKVAAALVDRFGVTKEEAMKWLTAETSLASLILNPKYSAFLDYVADPDEVAIKQNSDYPQGTVDFSNICKKRREFTQVMNRVLRNFPSHVFAATDLAKIRTIMGEEGMTLPCGICYVEDRRQLDTIVAQDFIDGLKLYREGSKTRPDGKPFNANQLKGLQLTDGDTYVPTIYELVSLEGRNSLKAKNPNMEAAWVRYNNARGMQSVRLLTNEAEYKRQILKYSKKTVQSKNDHGGLRIYSFSDAEMFHLIDIIQVITDSAAVGLSLQGYTKVNEYAKAVKDTGEKLNRSLIPKGDLGYHVENGKVVLDYDTVEGIDITSDDFFDNKDNPDIGNITIGINDIQIRSAMVSDFVDQIIPFHTGQSEEVLGEKGIAAWKNYKDFQTEKDLATGKTSSHQVNIYTEVIQAAEEEGKPIQNKRQFVEKFLQVCKENGLQPRFSQFLNTDAQGNYIYTEGYHKFLVDFKTFAQSEVGEYLPQGPVKPIFDDAYITGLLKAYVKEQKAKDADVAKQMPKVIERITNEIIKPAEAQFSDRDSDGNQLSAEQQEFFKDSKARDKKGNLLRLYHGSNYRVTKFNPMFSDDKTSLFMTDKFDVAASYTRRYRELNPYEYIDADSTVKELLEAAEKFVVGKYNLQPVSEAEIEEAMALVIPKMPSIIEKLNNISQKLNDSNLRNTFGARGLSRNMYTAMDTLGSNPIKTDYEKLLAKNIGNYHWLAVVADSVESFLEFDRFSFVHADIEEVVQEIGSIRAEAALIHEKVAYGNGSVFRYEDNFGRPAFISETMLRKEINLSTTGGILPVYANITNPFVVDAKGRRWNNIATPTEMRSFHDHDVTNTRTVAAYAKANGYDGVIFNGLVDMGGDSAQKSQRSTIVIAFDGTQMKSTMNKTPTTDPDIRYSERVTDQETLDFLNEQFKNGEVTEVYRAMTVDDEGNLYPPMAGYVRRNGKKIINGHPSVVGEWEQSTESIPWNSVDEEFLVGNGFKHFESPTKDYPNGRFERDNTIFYKNKNGEWKAKFHLDKDNGSTVDAAYAPYIHTSLSVLNDQFTSAYTRENLVVVKGYVPNSEVYGVNGKRYQANFADKPVGRTKWHSGVVAAQMPETRTVILSRYFMPIEIVDDSVIAQKTKEMMKGKDIEIPYNVVTPSQRRAMEAIGIRIGEARGLKDAPKKADVKYSDRDADSVSNRSLLANAFEGVAQNDIEKQKIQEYKGKISLINAEEQKLSELNEKIKDLSFSKGPRDTKAIRDLQFEARQTANRINVYDKQLLRLEASKPLQDVLTREKKMAYQRAEKKGKEALEAYRERTMKTQRELLDKWQTSRKKGIDSRHRTAMRHKIKDVVNELNQYLLRGTKDRHVPIELQKAVAEALDAVNMDTVGAEERIAKLRDELLKAKTPEQIQEISRKIDRIQEMGDKMNGRLQKLKDAYDQFVNSDDPLIANSHDEVISNKLQSVIETVGDTPLRDMTLSQLEDVYDMYRMVLTTIRNANKAFKAKKSESISTIANRVMMEVEKVGGKKKLTMKGIDGIKSFGWNNLKPVYAFEHIGSDAFTEVFNNVRDGEDIWALDVTEAREFYLDKSKKHNYDSWDFKKRYKFTSTSGMDFELNLEQIMSLYAYSKREQAADHLKKGGIVIDETTEITVKNKLGIPVKFNPTEATAYNISEETLADIISKLTKEQQSFVNEMQDYLSTVMGAKGNEVSLEMYGIKLFKEKFYFPLKSAQQFMAKAKEQAQGEAKIKNSGFSKETVQKASNPIVLTPFMNVWANHVNEMSMYHAFVLPMEDFYRVYNYKTPTSDTMATESVEMFIQNAYGKSATKYIDQLLKDLNGGARTDSTTGIINKMMGLFKKGAVFASMSVVIQQPSAIARAAALVDTKYFIGPKVDHKRHKALWNEIKQYAPVAIIKEMGYFDTNMGKSTQDFIIGKEYSGFKEKMSALVKDSGYRDEVLSKAPALADEIAWCGIWEAVKRETEAKNPGMDAKSDAFLKMAGERFTDVIVKTQVYDSVLSRSGIMRSKDTGMKMATAFMAEPTTSINMIADALLQGKRGNIKYCRSAIGAVIASQILNAILVSFVYAGRDDDDDETYLEKYIGSFVGETLESLNPASYIPFIKDIISIVQGYDVERSDMAVINDLWNAWKNLSKENISTYRKVEGFAGSVAQIFGLPVKNIMRDARGIYQTVMSFVDGEHNTLAGIGYAVKGAITGKTVSDSQQLYEAYLNGDTDQISRVSGRFKDQNSINNAISKALRENDPRIKEAAQAQINGDPSERVRIARQIIADGFKQDDVVRAINTEINAMTSSGGSTGANKKSGFYTASDFALEVANGDYAAVNAARADIIKTAKDNGKTEEDALHSFVSYAKSELGNLYVSGNITRQKLSNALRTYCDMDDDEIYWQLDKLDYAKETGSTDGYGKYNDFYTAVQTGKNLKAVIKEYTDNGVEAKTMASEITSHFKPLYKEMSNAERAGIKGYLLNAYALLGYDRSKKSKDIDKWLED